MSRFVVPLGVFVILVVFLGIGLTLDPKRVPSPFIDQAAPTFSLPSLDQESLSVGTESMKGKVWLLNVWASWCAACRVEHPLLNNLAKLDLIELVGLNYKDERQAAKQWLEQFGNPYSHIAWDNKGDVGIDFGVYGVPESFLIDRDGVIRFKQIGPFTERDIEQQLLPLIKQLRAES